MARSDLIIGLVKAGVQGDRSLFQRTVDAIIAEERGKQHHVLADQLEDTVRRNGKTAPSQQILSTGTHQALLHETVPQRGLSTLVTAARKVTQCSVKFIRWLRQSLRDHATEAAAEARLQALYATLGS